MSPPGSYGSQVTAQLHDGPLSPPSRGGAHVLQQQQQQQHNQQHAPATHTTLPDGSTRIQIQRAGALPPAAQQASGPPLPPTPKAYTEDGSPFFNDSGRMPDYTIPYKQGDPYHEHTGAGGGVYDDDGYR